jgi:GTP-binding protein
MRWQARFVKSASVFEDCPRWKAREAAFAGRSNAGKSSLINALTGVQGLARISKKPGRTQSINFFTLNDELALVDLPGYGYARLPEREANRIASMVRAYLAHRENLALLVMIIDVRRGPSNDDLALAQAAEDRGIRLVVAANKIDRLRRSETAGALRPFLKIAARIIPCSAVDDEGIDTLRRAIVDLASAAEHPGEGAA